MSDCFWIEDMQPDGDIAWQTTCANMFVFMADGPDENNFKFCPNCGGELTHTKQQESSDTSNSE